MKERPRIKLTLSPTDKALEIIGMTMIVLTWTYTILHYTSLPDIIPTHFNGAGIADNEGSKNTILFIPIISTVLFIGMTYLNKYPHTFNYPTAITEDNAHKQYTLSTQLVRNLKLIIAAIFGLIVFQTIRVAKGEIDGLGAWFSPVVIGLMVIPLGWYIVKARKLA